MLADNLGLPPRRETSHRTFNQRCHASSYALMLCNTHRSPIGGNGPNSLKQLQGFTSINTYAQPTIWGPGLYESRTAADQKFLLLNTSHWSWRGLRAVVKSAHCSCVESEFTFLAPSAPIRRFTFLHNSSSQRWDPVTSFDLCKHLNTHDPQTQLRPTHIHIK